MSRRSLPCTALLCLLVGAGAALAQGTLPGVPDHLKCYDIQDKLPTKIYTTVLMNQFGEEICKVRTPALFFCSDTVKSSVTPQHPGGGPGGTPAADYLCYQILSCQGATPPQREVEDQFGRRIISFQKARLLCAPAKKIECGYCYDPILNVCTDIQCSPDFRCPKPNMICSPTLCPSADCPCCPVCGDGVCEGDENGCNCSADCGISPCLDVLSLCGNGVCERYYSPAESHENCPQDCPLNCDEDCPEKNCCYCAGQPTTCVPPKACKGTLCAIGLSCDTDADCPPPPPQCPKGDFGQCLPKECILPSGVLSKCLPTAEGTCECYEPPPPVCPPDATGHCENQPCITPSGNHSKCVLTPAGCDCPEPQCPVGPEGQCIDQTCITPSGNLSKCKQTAVGLCDCPEPEPEPQCPSDVGVHCANQPCIAPSGLPSKCKPAPTGKCECPEPGPEPLCPTDPTVPCTNQPCIAPSGLVSKCVQTAAGCDCPEPPPPNPCPPDSTGSCVNQPCISPSGTQSKCVQTPIPGVCDCPDPPPPGQCPTDPAQCAQQPCTTATGVPGHCLQTAAGAPCTCQ